MSLVLTIKPGQIVEVTPRDDEPIRLVYVGLKKTRMRFSAPQTTKIELLKEETS